MKQRLDGKIKQARLVLAWEAIWNAAFPAILVLGLFAVAVLSGLLANLPDIVRYVALALFAAAFLWSLDCLIRGTLEAGSVKVLYVSPLRALNSDVRANLLTPLAEIRRLFDREGKPFRDIRVFTRSGDTPSSERRRMRRHPPEILITTPESLNIILSGQSGQVLLGDVRDIPLLRQ